MKLTFSSGIVCLLFGTLACFAQQEPSTDADSPQQTPAQQQPPPAQQPPPPATVPGTPSAPKPTVQLPPPVPQVTPTPAQERDTGGDTFSIMPFYWYNTAQPVMRGGFGDTTFLPGNVHFNGRKKYSYGGLLTVPTGRENSLEFTY